MIKSISLFILLGIYTSVISQAKLPSYYDVVKMFCSKYVSLKEDDNYTSFAKKRDGWYIQQVNRFQNDSVLSEHMFFNPFQTNYKDLSDFYEKAENPNIDSLIEKYLIASGSFVDWYCFERSPYYGYNEWFSDMIYDYGEKDNLNENELDGLGRAYVVLATSYLWNQYGIHMPVSDSFTRKLGRIEYPSPQRTLKVKELLDKAASQFEKIKNLNPGYLTLVGNGTLKFFNECMNGYTQMTMCGNDSLAKKFLDRAILPELYVKQAKNYLNSCGQNSILFTYGDNDTYQLWYIQQKYNYRKDVLVINNSLLGLTIYIDMFKRKKLLKLSIPNSYLEDVTGDVACYTEKKEGINQNQKIPLSTFLNDIYSKKFPLITYGERSYSTYSCSTVFLRFPVKTGKQISLSPGKPYCMLNDMVMFDIILNNNSRPIYFTSSSGSLFQTNLIQEGIVYKLTNENAKSIVQKEKEIKSLEKFIAEKHIPVVSKEAEFVSFDGDNTLFGMYYKLSKYYYEKNDVKNCRKWIRKLDELVPVVSPCQVKTYHYMYDLYDIVNMKDKSETIIIQYANWLKDSYSNPSPLNGFYSKKNYVDELNDLKPIAEKYPKANNLVDGLLNEVEDLENSLD